MRAYNIFVCGF